MANGFLTEIHDYGALASRPAAASALEGYYYTASDTGITYRCNGSSWDEEAINTTAHASIDHTGITGVGGGGISSGSSFPVSPSDGDLYYRTDLDLLCRYRSTGTRWVTTTQYRAVMSSFANTLTGNQVSARMVGPSSSGYAWWLERVEWTAYVTTTNTGTQYWTGQLQSWDGGTGPTTIGSAMSTVSLAADAYLALSTSPATSIAATVEELEFAYTKVSTAGTLIVVGPTIVYRLIVT